MNEEKEVRASPAESGKQDEADAHKPAENKEEREGKLGRGGKKGRGARSREKEAVKKKDDELKASQDRLLRLQADFDNFRKRTLREKNDLYRRANEDLIAELLPVLDHVEMALASLSSDDPADPAIEGFKLVAEQLATALKKFGLSPIDAEGAEFDHNVHEAISHLPSEDVAENMVIAQVRRGYMLGDNLLRPAQTVVSSGPASQDKPTDDSGTGDRK